jgi:hypothetical protein
MQPFFMRRPLEKVRLSQLEDSIMKPNQTPRPTTKELIIRIFDLIELSPPACDYVSAWFLFTSSVHIVQDFYFGPYFYDLDSEKPQRKIAIDNETIFLGDNPNIQLRVISGYQILCGVAGAIKIVTVRQPTITILNKTGADGSLI